MHALLRLIEVKEIVLVNESRVDENDHLFFNVNTRGEAEEAENILIRGESKRFGG